MKYERVYYCEQLDRTGQGSRYVALLVGQAEPRSEGRVYTDPIPTELPRARSSPFPFF